MGNKLRHEDERAYVIASILLISILACVVLYSSNQQDNNSNNKNLPKSIRIKKVEISSTGLQISVIESWKCNNYDNNVVNNIAAPIKTNLNLNYENIPKTLIKY